MAGGELGHCDIDELEGQLLSGLVHSLAYNLLCTDVLSYCLRCHKKVHLVTKYRVCRTSSVEFSFIYMSTKVTCYKKFNMFITENDIHRCGSFEEQQNQRSWV